MKHFNHKITVAFALIMLLLISCSQNSPINPPANVAIDNANHYIVVLKKSNVSNNDVQSYASSRNEVLAFIKSNNISESAVGHVYEYVLKGFSADLTDDQLAALRKDSKVDFIEKDREMYIVGQPVGQVVMANDKTIQSQTTPWGITRVGGPSSATTFGRAWIVDTGINLTHPDLNVLTSLSKTFVRYGSDSRSPEDYNGHGTHLSGTIAAKNNSFGVVGVAPGAGVIAVKVLNRYGSGYLSDIIAGLNYVYSNAHNNDVMNCSWGGGQSSALDNAIQQFATRNGSTGPFVWVSIAAGNSSADANNFSPARVNGAGIFTNSAFDSQDVFAWFSNWGNPPIDYSGPGVNILSTYKNQQYAYMSGTSMATPHIAGIILARIAANLSGTPAINGYVTSDPDGNPDPIAHE